MPPFPQRLAIVIFLIGIPCALSAIARATDPSQLTRLIFMAGLPFVTGLSFPGGRLP